LNANDGKRDEVAHCGKADDRRMRIERSDVTEEAFRRKGGRCALFYSRREEYRTVAERRRRLARSKAEG
jgi:hypothetical protein